MDATRARLEWRGISGLPRFDELRRSWTCLAPSRRLGVFTPYLPSFGARPHTGAITTGLSSVVPTEFELIAHTAGLASRNKRNALDLVATNPDAAVNERFVSEVDMIAAMLMARRAN